MALISHGIQSQSMVWLAGQGKKHGSYLFGDSMISTPTVLSEVRLSEAASKSPDGQPRQKRRPNAEDVQSFEQQLQEEMERRLHQQREGREQKLKQEREEMDRKLHQERELEWKRQQDREAWEAEMQPEQDYYKNPYW
jgi:membrane protein involved in colicin uptake